MTFEIVNILEKMRELYMKPATFDRFKEYIKILKGNTDNDLEIPIAGFNPMAKSHVLDKLDELIELKAEKIAAEAIAKINNNQNQDNSEVFKVFLNLSDDLKGGWTNRFTSDYDSKFKINGLVSRKLCTPILWTSEEYSEELIWQRTSEYIYRTIYRLKNPNPRTLKEHIEQEIYVAGKINLEGIPGDFDLLASQNFFCENMNSENHALIFNFLYGDAASASLEFKTFGVNDNMTGFKFAMIQGNLQKHE